MGNPANRLHAILVRAKQKELQSKPMLQSWRNVLQLPDDIDDLLVMNKIGKVFTLPFVITTYISRFADLDAELYLGWRNDLGAAFRHVHFNTNFSEFGSRLSDSLLISIRFCDHELEKRMPEKAVSREELNTVRESAWSLYEEVLASDLPPHLFSYLLDHLYLIIEAIDDFDITGAAGVERSLNSVIGSVATDMGTAREANESPFGERFWGVMAKAGVALKLAKTALELADGVRKFLPHSQ
jgi:hypothetical protein